MGLWQTVITVVRRWGDWFQDGEDPENTIEHTILAMQGELLSLRQAWAQAIATQKRNERHCQHHQTLAQEWQHRAQQALDIGDEEQAREALVQAYPHEEIAQKLQAQLPPQRQLVRQLQREWHRLEKQINEAKLQKDLYVSRSESAIATQKLQALNQTFGPAHPGPHSLLPDHLAPLPGDDLLNPTISPEPSPQNCPATFQSTAQERHHPRITARLRQLQQPQKRSPPPAP